MAHITSGLPGDEPRLTEVSVVDIDMPFGSMVTFMLKWALATIPAFLILLGVGALVIVLMGGLGGLFGVR